jgi:hypothetical protein
VIHIPWQPVLTVQLVWYIPPRMIQLRSDCAKECKSYSISTVICITYLSHSHRKSTKFEWLLPKDSSLTVVFRWKRASEKIIGTVYVSLTRRHYKSLQPGWVTRTKSYYLIVCL